MTLRVAVIYEKIITDFKYKVKFLILFFFSTDGNIKRYERFPVTRPITVSVWNFTRVHFIFIAKLISPRFVEFHTQ